MLFNREVIELGRQVIKKQERIKTLLNTVDITRIGVLKDTGKKYGLKF